MNNTLAIILGVLIIAGVASDVVLTGGETLLFLAKKFMNLMDWLAFWR